MGSIAAPVKLFNKVSFVNGFSTAVVFVKIFFVEINSNTCYHIVNIVNIINILWYIND